MPPTFMRTFVSPFLITLLLGACVLYAANARTLRSPHSTDPVSRMTMNVDSATSTREGSPDTQPITFTRASTLKYATTTVFWIGERADASNGYIANADSAWDDEWQEHYGGYDDPERRCGFKPCNFNPRENPFYVALPYNDLDAQGLVRPEAPTIVPWWHASSTLKSQLKNTWVAITHKTRTCYGQWQDVGPSLEDDAAYVFGTSSPQNTFGLQAGLDVSPALATCLHLDGVGSIAWTFVDESEVPPGPWKDVVTTRDVSWH